MFSVQKIPLLGLVCSRLWVPCAALAWGKWIAGEKQGGSLARKGNGHTFFFSGLC